MKTPVINSKPLVKAHLTGALKHNSRVINEQAVRELMARNVYWSLGITAVDTREHDPEAAMATVVAALGQTRAEFEARDDSFINPDTTATQLLAAETALMAAAARGDRFVFATGHPGSLAELYSRWGTRLTAGGGHVYQLPERLDAGHGHYLDQVAGVIMLSDEGTLMHTHDAGGFDALLAQAKPDWVIADHGFAGAAINHGVSTVSLFDSDDPAIPIAATLVPHVIAVPMNDNQTNVLTANAVDAFLMARHDS